MKNKTLIISSLIIISALFLISCGSKDNFGPYGSIHSHADFKVYILGKPLNFSDLYQGIPLENFRGFLENSSLCFRLQK